MAGKSYDQKAIGVGIAFALAVWFIIAGIRDLRASNRVMSELFGFKIGFRADPGPPKLGAHYEKWCRAHGVVPFAADAQRQVPSTEAGAVDPPPVTATQPGA